MAIGRGLVSERWLETGITVKAPFLLRIAVCVLDREDVQAMPLVDLGASWAPKGVAHDPPGVVFKRRQERVHGKIMGAGSHGARRELRSGWLRGGHYRASGTFVGDEGLCRRVFRPIYFLEAIASMFQRGQLRRDDCPLLKCLVLPPRVRAGGVRWFLSSNERSGINRTNWCDFRPAIFKFASFAAATAIRFIASIA